MKHLMLACVLIVSASQATAQPLPPSSCSQKTIIAHVNGVNVEDADSNRQALKRAIDVHSADSRDVSYEFVYNDTSGLRRDLAETVEQWSRDKGFSLNVVNQLAARISSAVVAGLVDVVLDSNPLINIGETEQKELIEIVEERTRAWIEYGWLNDASERSNRVRDRLVTALRTWVSSGYRVIIVPHSQGNFVVNEAIQLLNASERLYIRNLATATPASNILNATDFHRPYVSLVRDLVPLGAPDALPVNTNNNPQSIISRLVDLIAPNAGKLSSWLDRCRADPLLNHSFVGCYLPDASVSLDRIKEMVNYELANLTFPEQTISSGLIQVTLTWGSQPDLDLHVFEPGGNQVYYANKIGINGRLDVDDVDGYGPENFFVCAQENLLNVPDGSRFSIGVNYYSGEEPEQGEISVKAGDVTRTFPISVHESRGASGDDSPEPVAQIIVNHNDESGVKFSVIGL